ncbi:motility protein A, partial [bacterium]|nr:motility protein A [bacterium]
IGILGAVLGLIHVMSMLNDPSKIGEGIAVAFVATVYGVALANLVFLPWGSKLKRLAEENAQTKELVMQGVLGIQEGLNPNFLGEKLRVFLHDAGKKA